jgi:CBS domain-containing protein
VTTVTVREIMRTDVPIVAPEDSVARVSRVLSDSNLPGVPVVEDGAIIGIVTDKDIIQREANISSPTVVPFLDAFFVLDAGRDLDDELHRVLATSARDLMTEPVINIRDSATLEETATVMLDMGVSVLPVLDDANALVGIVSRHDLVNVIARLESDGIA